MSRSKRPRKVYRPRNVNPQAHLDAMRGVCLPNVTDRTIWQSALTDAIDAIAQGKAQTAHWSEIFDAINILEQLVLDGMAHDEGGQLKAAQDACEAILNRKRDTGVRAVRASELAALRAVVQDWDDTIRQITYGERTRLLKRVNERIYRVRHTLMSPDEAVRIIEA